MRTHSTNTVTWNKKGSGLTHVMSTCNHVMNHGSTLKKAHFNIIRKALPIQLRWDVRSKILCTCTTGAETKAPTKLIESILMLSCLENAWFVDRTCWSCVGHCLAACLKSFTNSRFEGKLLRAKLYLRKTDDPFRQTWGPIVMNQRGLVDVGFVWVILQFCSFSGLQLASHAQFLACVFWYFAAASCRSYAFHSLACYNTTSNYLWPPAAACWSWTPTGR